MSINKPFEHMTYKEFTAYCNERACDGQWGMIEALNCLALTSHINAIKVTGFFKKRKTELAREEAWQKVIAEIKERASFDVDKR